MNKTKDRIFFLNVKHEPYDKLIGRIEEIDFQSGQSTQWGLD